MVRRTDLERIGVFLFLKSFVGKLLDSQRDTAPHSPALMLPQSEKENVAFRSEATMLLSKNFFNSSDIFVCSPVLALVYACIFTNSSITKRVVQRARMGLLRFARQR
ncbi:hypothetical protein BZM26_29010 [Paraburkholderia strydomiana]|nr:hypothetical protein BZM26_29010 [Paraburkholderia strydomiana]